MKLSPTKTARNRTSAGLAILRSTSYMPQELAGGPTGGGVDRSTRAGQAGTKWPAAISLPANAAMTAPQMPPSQIALLILDPSSARMNADPQDGHLCGDNPPSMP